MSNFETGAFALSDMPADPCTAALAKLPVSGEFVESDLVHGWVGPSPDKDAKADLRRKLSTLRQWPLCPVSGTPYEVRAECAYSLGYQRGRPQRAPFRHGYLVRPFNVAVDESPVPRLAPPLLDVLERVLRIDPRGLEE